jgi:hypothetical protein
MGALIQAVDDALATTYPISRHAPLHIPIIKVYGFGTPRIGNEDFGHLCSEFLPNIFRLEVDGDVVPMTPKIFRMYAPTGVQVLLSDDESGNILVNPSRMETHMLSKQQYSIVNHDLAVYRRNLEACFEADDLREYLEKEHTWTMECGTWSDAKPASVLGHNNVPISKIRQKMSSSSLTSSQDGLQTHSHVHELPQWVWPVRHKRR